MITVGLTGNVAAGKSAVADAWRRAGIPVLNADAVARDVVAPGTPGLEEVVEAFGPGVLEDTGSLDRAAVRKLVFRDARARARLEAIIHPRVQEERDRWLAAREAEGHALAVLEIPLLFEVGADQVVDRVVVVDADPDIRLARMRTHRGLEEDEARRIMASQMDPAEKRARADHIIVNEGTLADLEAAAARVLERLSRPVD